jgi:hypothetical protein
VLGFFCNNVFVHHPIPLKPFSTPPKLYTGFRFREFSRFSHISVCLFTVKDYVLVHPALHVSLSGTCVYIPPFPPTTGSDNMPASRDLSRLSLACFGFVRLPSKMHLPCSWNVCVAMSFGLALHHMTQFVSSFVGTIKRHQSRHFCWSSGPRLSHRITFRPC